MSWFFSSNPNPTGFGSSSTAEEVTQGIDASSITAIVTGGSSGIGTETVRILAKRGAQVVIAVRNVDAGLKTKESILKENPDARLHVLELDLSSLASVRKFAADFESQNLPLNLLVNNAGVMACPFQLSVDGIEMQFATNYIGHFLLTNLLLDKMKSTAEMTGIEGRIVNVSSMVHSFSPWQGINFDHINDKSCYSPYVAYGQSKLANILHSNELTRRLKAEGANITANSLHPGIINSNLQRHSRRFYAVLMPLTKFMWKSIPQGAATQCYIGLHPNMKGVSGKYFVDCNEAKPKALALDESLAKKLWDFSVKLTLE